MKSSCSSRIEANASMYGVAHAPVLDGFVHTPSTRTSLSGSSTSTPSAYEVGSDPSGWT